MEQQFAIAIVIWKHAGCFEMVHSRLCQILLFQDMRSLCGLSAAVCLAFDPIAVASQV